jgi:hypothetical protein
MLIILWVFDWVIELVSSVNEWAQINNHIQAIARHKKHILLP